MQSRDSIKHLHKNVFYWFNREVKPVKHDNVNLIRQVLLNTINISTSANIHEYVTGKIDFLIFVDKTKKSDPFEIILKLLLYYSNDSFKIKKNPRAELLFEYFSPVSLNQFFNVLDITDSVDDAICFIQNNKHISSIEETLPELI